LGTGLNVPDLWPLAGEKRDTALEQRYVGLVLVADLPIITVFIDHHYVKELGQALDVFSFMDQQEFGQVLTVPILKKNEFGLGVHIAF